jgi:hypothetical protein
VRRRWKAACLAAALAVPAGCVGLQRGDVYPDGGDEVCVSYFGNETFYRDVEFELTERLVDEILSSPGLRLSSRETAEISLSGRVLDVSQRVLSETRSQVPTSSTTAVTVEIVVTDARTGQELKRRRLTQRGQFVPARGEDLEFARREAFRYLARDIVRELEEDF